MLASEFIIESVENNDTYTIPAENWGMLEHKIESLNKKGAKIGAAPVTIKKGKTTTKTFNKGKDNEYTRQYYDVTVDGEAPKIDGWKLLAALEFENNKPVIRGVPGENDLPEKYHDADPRVCDHCEINRDRKHGYIIQHDIDGIMQVGRSCLKNFLGHTDPKFILVMAQILVGLADARSNAENDNYRDTKSPIRHSTETFLAYVSASIRRDGWTSRANRSEDRVPTADSVFSSMYPRTKYDFEDRLALTDADYEAGTKALTWVRDELPKKRDSEKKLSDFEHNLLVLAGSDTFKSKDSGYIAAIMNAHKRSKEDKKAEKAMGETEFYGVENKIMDPIKLKLLEIKEIDGQKGKMFIHKFIDESKKHYITWFAFNETGFQIGDWDTYTGKVIGHKIDSYNNNAKTTTVKDLNISTGDNVDEETESVYVGEIGTKYGGKKGKSPWEETPFKLKLMTINKVTSQYSDGYAYVHKFVDESGNAFTWWASKDNDLEIGGWNKYSATVKGHKLDTFNGANTKTTWLKLMKVVS